MRISLVLAALLFSGAAHAQSFKCLSTKSTAVFSISGSKLKVSDSLYGKFEAHQVGPAAMRAGGSTITFVSEEGQVVLEMGYGARMRPFLSSATISGRGMNVVYGDCESVVR